MSGSQAALHYLRTASGDCLGSRARLSSVVSASVLTVTVVDTSRRKRLSLIVLLFAYIYIYIYIYLYVCVGGLIGVIPVVIIHEARS